MKRFYISMFLLGLVPGLVCATPLVPSLGGNKGLYHVMAADLGYPGVFHFRMGLRIFTSDLGCYYPYQTAWDAPIYIDSSSTALDTYFGSDFDYAISLAVTKRIEINIRGRYKGDAIDTQDKPRIPGRPRCGSKPYEWYYSGWENRASIDRGDTDIGLKLILCKLFRTPVDFALYPHVDIPTGEKQNRDTSDMYYASYFGRHTAWGNDGGVFRYFTNGRVAPGIFFLFSGTNKSESPISGYLNLGYQVKYASEFQYGLAADVLFFDYFDPYIEFWGSRRSLLGDDPFGDHPPSYLTLGMKFIGTGISGDIGVDFLVIGKRKYEFKDFFPTNEAEAQEKYVATGWGMRPTWAINLGFAYSHDLYRGAPISNKGMIMGKVANAVTEKGIDAVISATGTPRLISEPLTGSYEAKVSPGKVRVVVAKDGYRGETKLVTLSRGERVVLDFKLQPIVQHAAIIGKAIDKWSTKPVENAEMIISREKKKLPGGVAIEASKLTKTLGDKTYKLNPETNAWELTPESVTESDITMVIDGELQKLNTTTGEWEKIGGMTLPPVSKEDITTMIDGELHRLNIITGEWEKVKGGAKFEDVVKKDDITQTIDGELYTLNMVTGAWEKVKTSAANIEELADTVSTTNVDGLYKLEMVPSGTHLVTAKKEGYITQVSPVVCKPDETALLNFELFAETIVLRGVHFEFDKSDLLVDSYPILERVYEFLKDNPDIRAEIGGHTDSVANDEYNIDLSNRRVNAVRNYLIMHGIDSDRIVTKGYGETKPITENDTEEGRALNRRIELKILK
ncbi:MAG: OmpA family protein [Candidatus Stahlbacteria bacterium]|nr:OmpA family protein [Candidatus Stahlbacteria bacterium]